MQLTHVTNGGLEAPSPGAGRFFSKKKNSHFTGIPIKFRTYVEPFEKTKLLRFESQLKN